MFVIGGSSGDARTTVGGPWIQLWQFDDTLPSGGATLMMLLLMMMRVGGLAAAAAARDDDGDAVRPLAAGVRHHAIHDRQAGCQLDLLRLVTHQICRARKKNRHHVFSGRNCTVIDIKRQETAYICKY